MRPYEQLSKDYVARMTELINRYLATEHRLERVATHGEMMGLLWGAFLVPDSFSAPNKLHERLDTMVKAAMGTKSIQETPIVAVIGNEQL